MYTVTSCNMCPSSNKLPLHTYRWKPLHKGPKVKIFKKKSLSDTGCGRTVFAKDILDRYRIPYQKNSRGERLLAANGEEMHINGVLKITGTFQGKSKVMDCLVSDDLHEEIIVAGHDASAVGAVYITPDIEEENEEKANPHIQCAAINVHITADVEEKPEEEASPNTRCATINSKTPCQKVKEASQNTRCATINSKTPCQKVKEFLSHIFEKYTCLSDKISPKPMQGFPDMVINIDENAERGKG